MRQISVGARNSPLSKAQVDEIMRELSSHRQDVEFLCIFLQTLGDKDQKTSLRTLDKTDFFTKEVDDLVLKGRCRIGIHSAKDLPEPLTQGLSLIALTKGVDSSDALVLREGEKLETLPSDSVIATSSERRENTVKELRKDLRFIDLRGTIGQRLAKLETGEADGIVVAEAALIRLGLTHLNRVILPGETVLNQGKLAIVAKQNDREMQEFFACIDSRK